MSKTITQYFRQGIGSIVGSYIKINYGDKIYSLNSCLGNMEIGVETAKGRLVTAVYWIVDEEFDINRLTFKDANINFCNNITPINASSSMIWKHNGIPYVNTNMITKNKTVEFKFDFSKTYDGEDVTEHISSNKIFFAFISIPEEPIDADLYDYDTSALTVVINEGIGEYYYRKNGDSNTITSLQQMNTGGLLITSKDIKSITLEDTNSSDYGVPDKIKCSKLSYRTWSQPLDNTSKNGWADGGENYDPDHKAAGIYNSNGKFANKFDIDEGKLKDVIFANPDKGSYVSNGINEARWVFKRSRIMFEIPPLTTRDGRKIGTTLRYRVEASIYDKNAYKNNYITQSYSAEETAKGITLVICPRDEGIKDNTEFRVVLDRCYAGSAVYSEQAVYYFRTYQKPVVNIAYPKMVRNKATGDGFKHAKILTSNMYSNFTGENAIVNKYVCDALNLLVASPKPDASGIPLFVRFYVAEYKFGRNGCLYTADDLDGDVKEGHEDYGKPVKIKRDKNGVPYAADDGNYEINPDYKFDTMQDVYKSKYERDYVSLEEILNGESEKLTAYMTGINNCDGSPIILSGRLTDKQIKDLITDNNGQQLQLWTYRKWDYVIDAENDIQTGNAYPFATDEHDENGIEVRYKDVNRTEPITDITSEEYNDLEQNYRKSVIISRDVEGDHCGNAVIESTYDDGDAKSVKYNSSSILLFRAGYVYLIRMRIFHGAAAGAINAKYGLKNATIYGYGKDSPYPTSGLYDYSSNVAYGGQYPYVEKNGEVLLDDISQFGNEKPYFWNDKNWVGPDDGTTGLSLNSDALNQTYPGFSEVDYSLVEPICPYTSKTNLVTVHPTSPQIGANQWLSFNYRHLSKNIGQIETYALKPATDTDPEKLTIDSFGYTNGGVLNTISRIMSMYTSCVETILQNYCTQNGASVTDSRNVNAFKELWSSCYKKPDNSDNITTILSEKISLWIKGVNERIVDPNIPISKHKDSSKKETIYAYKYVNSKEKTDNIPLINAYDCVGANTHISRSFSDIRNSTFYTHYIKEGDLDTSIPYNTENSYSFNGESGCFVYNQFRAFYNVENENYYDLNSEKYKESVTPFYNFSEDVIHEIEYKINDTDKLTYKIAHTSPDSWPETQIIYIQHNQYDEDGGTIDNRKEIEEDPLGNTYRWQPVINAQIDNLTEIQIEGQQNINAYSGNNTLNNTNSIVNLKYDDKTVYSKTKKKDVLNPEFDIQTKYFYKDQYPNLGINKDKDFLSNNDNKRFTIKEFAGVTTNDPTSSGYPAMYTTANVKKGSYSNGDNFIRFFAISSYEKTYGQLYYRVPSIQDCENGEITAYDSSINKYSSSLSNIGGILSKIHDKQPTIDEDFNNVYPLTRTTHYLYFKTWINTTFVMTSQLEIECKEPVYDKNGNISDYVTKKAEGAMYFDGEKMLLMTDEKGNLISPPEIKFGNEKGLSEVYGEDNNGWGRCLSADDNCARKLSYDGNISTKTASGGIEVPIMVRYTPLLQPQIASESLSGSEVLLNKSKNVTIHYASQAYKGDTFSCDALCVKYIESWKEVTPLAVFTYSEDFVNSNLEKINEFNLNIYYPFIPENNTYHTVLANGGMGNNVYYKDYYIDVDTDNSKSLEDRLSSIDATNLDFLGGYGICTAYTVLLVPSDPDLNLSHLSKVESKSFIDKELQYFTNSDGHWNYFKQPANYYSTSDIFEKVRSQTISDAGAVLVAYCVGPDDETIIDYISSDYKGDLPNNWITKDKINANIKGRCFKSVSINFEKLLDGEVLIRDGNNTSTDKYVSMQDFNNLKSSLHNITLSDENKLKIGLSYDLVVIPVYDNTIITKYNYIGTAETAGTLNNTVYGASYNEDGENINSDSEKTVRFFGSNPFVSFNYLQIGNAVQDDVSYEKATWIEDYEKNIKGCSDCDILDTDHAIIFPNVDNSLFNIDEGIIKETPGFWLNNSFKLILRMPSFRTKTTQIGPNDLHTIEHLSNGLLNSSNGDTANDFEFEDIQIHIGKLEELKAYGYPNNMDNNLNNLTTKEELAAAHIISYKHYWSKDVFSKKLSDYNGTQLQDDREKVTAGALIPSDEHYKNRFIEVNLSNAEIMNENGEMVPIYSLYKEGYYIQFRWKSAYAAGNNSSQWSDWHGGSCDGGKKWWGNKGNLYFVPVRNYSDVHTDFRSYMKEAYPGSMINANVDQNTHDIINASIGAGSHSQYGGYDTATKTNPLSGGYPGYYHNGSGNREDSMIIPDITPIQTNCTVEFLNNHDNPYINNYIAKHDVEFKIPENISNLHQQMWEMLYIDYVIRNMSKLYYKPNYNYEITETYSITKNGTKENKTVTRCYLASPWDNNKPLLLNFKGAGWDDTEKYTDTETYDHKNYNEDKSNETSINNERITGPNKLEYDIAFSTVPINPNKTDAVKNVVNNNRQWNINKYYRKIITKHDFDELNRHLINLVKFTRNTLLTGAHVNNTTGLSNVDVLLPSEDNLKFDTSRKLLIGNSTDSSPGLTKNNNINHTMMSSNYIQNIWQNILSICKVGDNVTYKSTKIEKNIY